MDLEVAGFACDRAKGGEVIEVPVLLVFWRMLRREALQGGESVRGGMGNPISLLIGAIVVLVLLINPAAVALRTSPAPVYACLRVG